MIKSQKNALLLGASGLTGSFCLQDLLKSESYSSIIALVRQPLDISHPKLKQAVVDFDLTAGMEKYYDDIDDVFCCLGTTITKAGSQKAFRRVDFHIPTEAANMASSHGVKQFVAISAEGANNKSSNFYLRIKGEMEKGINQFNFDAIHIFRPSSEINNERSNNKSSSSFLRSVFSLFSSKKKTKDNSTSASILAKAMVNAAQGAKNGSFFYSSSQIQKLSQKDSISSSVENEILK
jgi:hypothetical protein